MTAIDVLLPTTSQYDVLHHFALKLYEALVRQGAKCRLLGGDERVIATLNQPPDFTIGFNGALKMEDGSFFCDHVRVPHVSCLVDPPFRFLDLVKSPNIFITCDDQEGCTLLKERGFDRTAFMPHAVEPELSFDEDVERIYDITFLGTCIDPERQKELWPSLFNPQTIRVMEEAIEACFADNETSFMTVLLKHLDPAEHQHAFEAVESYVKGVDRLRLLRSFSGSQVHVFGAGIGSYEWKEILKKGDFVVHPPITFEQALEVMKRSKIVLNSSIKNKLGAHERVFTAAACGAVVVTNDNPWMREQFRDGKELILYIPHTLEAARQHVVELLADEKKRKHMAALGRRRVMAAHTWDHRAKHLLKQIRQASSL